MKYTMKIVFLLIILGASLILLSCNTENEGVFMRISNSKIKVDVGYVDIIGMQGSDFYVYTEYNGLQKFDSTVSRWEHLDIVTPYQGLYATDNALNVGNLYIATRANDADNNNLYTYPIGGPISAADTSFKILEMNSQNNLMLVETAANDYDVVKISDSSIMDSFDGIFTDTPHIIAQDTTQFIISGVTATGYTHYFQNDTTPLGSADASFDDNPIVALLVDSSNTNIIVIDASGKVFKSTTGALTAFTLVDTIDNFPSRTPNFLAYPTFIYNNEIYLQNQNDKFIKITSAGVISDELDASFAEFLSGIRIKSFLESGSNIYAGTMKNGIVEITMTASGVGTAIIL